MTTIYSTLVEAVTGGIEPQQTLSARLTEKTTAIVYVKAEKLTFDFFKASCRKISPQDFSENYSEEAISDTKYVHLFLGCYYIYELENGFYDLPICNEEYYTKDYEELLLRLYYHIKAYDRNDKRNVTWERLDWILSLKKLAASAYNVCNKWEFDDDTFSYVGYDFKHEFSELTNIMGDYLRRQISLFIGDIDR